MIAKDKDSRCRLRSGDTVALTRPWCNFELGHKFTVLRVTRCEGGDFLRWNVKAVEFGLPTTDPFFERTLPGEYCVKWPAKDKRKIGLRGPGGLMLVLDKDRVVPDDPGADTPAILHWFGFSSTLWCGLDNGLEGPDGEERMLTPEMHEWLNEIESLVSKFLFEEK